ncbi:aftiphilin isoform X2 [Echinops telfairi]|uniref:Aftiphilin isoform X2 n=1 Tax=Echinops telfairi TaxID=9371 RepID=A0ABM0IXR0_ECHTE|nr:aftiphilin isoform X2 [Echinops telfairi]
MEPDIIRMYSSSPPPLDNGAEDDDDDEFGEFGGFSEVSPSGVGFVDFDAPDYPRPKEEFVPANHFMPIHDFSENVGSLTSFKPLKHGNEETGTTELTPVKGQAGVLLSATSKEIVSPQTLDTSIDGMKIPRDLNTALEQAQNVGTPGGFSPGDFRTDLTVVHQNQQSESCNGEKPPCLEILTNGFAVLETVNPQGTEDLDTVADSEGLTPRSTEYNLDSAPSPAEEFADFATFSKKERIQLDEKGCTVLKDREALTIQENNKINRVNELNSIKDLSLDRSSDNQGDTDSKDQVGISEVSIESSRGFSTEEQGPDALQQDALLHSSAQSHARSLAATEDHSEASRREQWQTEGKLDVFTPKSADYLCMDYIKTNDAANEVGSPKEEMTKFTKPQSPSILPTEENVMNDSQSLKNGDGRNDSVTGSDTNEDDFGAFGTACGTTPPFATGTQESMSDVTFEESSEHVPHFSEPVDDFGEFGDTNTVSCQEVTLTESDSKPTSDGLSEGCQLASKSSGTGIQPVSKLKRGQEGEFGDFDSVPNSQNDSSGFQDADDFADFSSAGPCQVADWDAFEEGQKENCSWAAFGDHQAAESHHRKEAWQSHRTDENVDAPGTPTTHRVPVAASRGAVAAGHFQESSTAVQTALLNRLERIFEACFPSVLVPAAEEEVTSLKHLLETSTLPVKAAREALADSGELLDVWTELQDIHDAHGLRYQWGGSHSNKKLLCSLGIDTRNILFTGNKKQPVIVPMYAAGLGMLEPTKEPLKPLSAAEKIASIGQTSTMAPEMNTCTSDQFQESLPPVQFDWSSSGLTNPLDGVDPELYELTTSKLELSTSSLKVTDTLARLMSTVEKTSTSTRKPKREEHLSEEAIQVIASLPDLTFMHAKVLMFPATLTPSPSSQEKAD